MNRSLTTLSAALAAALLSTVTPMPVASSAPGAQDPPPAAQPPAEHAPSPGTGTAQEPAGSADQGSASGRGSGTPHNALVAEQREAMARLDPWIGEWEGRGWAISRGGGRSEFTIHESVEPKLGGIALLIQGRGTSKHPETGEEFVSHDALAVLTRDPDADRYVFRHYSADGHAGEAELVPVEGGWRWGFTVPQSGTRVRFTIEIDGDLDGGTWHETGEVSTDGGESWFPMLDMTLRRTGDG